MHLVAEREHPLHQSVTWAAADTVASALSSQPPAVLEALETCTVAVAVNGCAEAYSGNTGSTRRLPVSYNVIFRIGNFTPFLQRTSFA